jgi:hypothetical protein
MKYIAVGITTDDAKKERLVTVCLGEMGNFYMNEEGARKLADDILRNANYLWPIDEKNI